MLTPQAEREIAAAFAAARAKTRAPLQGVLAQTSSDYALVPVLLAAVAAILAPWWWLRRADMAPSQVFFDQLLLFAVLLALASLARVRVALAPAALKRSAGHRAALVQFALRGLDRAPARNGVLLYVSLGERYARIVADAGWDARVSHAEWRAVIDALSADMARGEPERACARGRL